MDMRSAGYQNLKRVSEVKGREYEERWLANLMVTVMAEWKNYSQIIGREGKEEELRERNESERKTLFSLFSFRWNRRMAKRVNV